MLTARSDAGRRAHGRPDHSADPLPSRPPEVPVLASTLLVARTPELGGTRLPCWDQDPELYFAESPADVERAKALCAGCPARAACLSGALERGEPWGVWGGELVLSGVVVARKRPRGRPRKEVAA